MPVDVRKLIEARVHFGHQKSRWNPKMQYYIWGERNETHLIDVSKTAAGIEESVKFLKNVVQEGKQILFLGTKKAAEEAVFKAAKNLNMPYVVHRWIGGSFSNFVQVKKSVTKLGYLEDVVAKAKDIQFYTKKELNIFQKMVSRLERYVGGLRNFSFHDLGAIVIVDVAKEKSAVLEAVAMKIPIVGLVDTDTDPSLIDYVIPANDDSPQSIAAIFAYLEEGIQDALGDVERVKQAKRQEAKELSDQKTATDETGKENFEVVASASGFSDTDTESDLPGKKIVRSQARPVTKSTNSRKVSPVSKPVDRKK